MLKSIATVAKDSVTPGHGKPELVFVIQQDIADVVARKTITLIESADTFWPDLVQPFQGTQPDVFVVVKSHPDYPSFDVFGKTRWIKLLVNAFLASINSSSGEQPKVVVGVGIEAKWGMLFFATGR